MTDPQKTETNAAPVAAQQPSFFGLGIAPKLMDALQKAKYEVPTPIQHQAIPVAIGGKDVIGIAQTGTGKTLAFSIPMLQRLAAVKGKGLIMLPTRELALQVEETLQKIGRVIGLRTAVLIGGASMNRQKDMIQKKPHVIVATPGRLIDHLDQKTVTLKDVSVLVLDEADRMLDMGFAPQINRILENVPSERQTMLFSATMPEEITRIVSQYMQIPVRIEVVPPGTTAERVEQEIFFVHKADKARLLEKILAEYKGPVLVFSRTKFGARKLARLVKMMGHAAADIHSDRSLAQRRDALDGFKRGKYRVLIATDIAARGIDVTGIELVVNFDLPDQSDDYVHRIGRTGRAGRTGKAISFAMPDQKPDVKAIERLVRRQIPVKPLPGDLPVARAVGHIPDEPSPRDRFRTGGGRSQGGSRSGGRGGSSRTAPSGGRGGYGRSTGSSGTRQGARDDRDDAAPTTGAGASRGGAREGARTTGSSRPPLPGERRSYGGGSRSTAGAGSRDRKGGPRGKRRGPPKMDLHEDQFSGGQRRGKGPRKFYGGMGI